MDSKRETQENRLSRFYYGAPDAVFLQPERLVLLTLIVGSPLLCCNRKGAIEGKAEDGLDSTSYPDRRFTSNKRDDEDDEDDL